MDEHEPITITESSGNIFLDLGHSPEEAENLLMRSALMIEARELVRHRRLTQAAAARLFGVTQPRVSDLMRGKIGRFSIDGLLMMLFRAGVKVQLVVDEKAA